ncbi:MAG: hypothetical protein ACXV2C_01995 [Candidatus Bathyarchaeia archaeon]
MTVCFLLLLFLIFGKGDLHLLLSLISNWKKYSPSSYELWREHNLCVPSVNVAKKYFTLAKHLLSKPLTIAALTTWLTEGDGSRMKRGHLDQASFKELKDVDAAKLVAQYANNKKETFGTLFLSN